MIRDALPEDAATLTHIALTAKRFWLDHMFILPAFHKKGIDSGLFADMKKILAPKNQKCIRIFVDPNAQGFYEKMGASLLRFSDSSIPGRMIPVYEYRF